LSRFRRQVPPGRRRSVGAGRGGAGRGGAGRGGAGRGGARTWPVVGSGRGRAWARDWVRRGTGTGAGLGRWAVVTGQRQLWVAYVAPPLPPSAVRGLLLLLGSASRRQEQGGVRAERRCRAAGRCGCLGARNGFRGAKAGPICPGLPHLPAIALRPKGPSAIKWACCDMAVCAVVGRAVTWWFLPWLARLGARPRCRVARDRRSPGVHCCRPTPVLQHAHLITDEPQRPLRAPVDQVNRLCAYPARSERHADRRARAGQGRAAIGVVRFGVTRPTFGSLVRQIPNDMSDMT
jgi:hypothetical protein